MPEIILFGYAISVYTQKLQYLLGLFRLPYKLCIQPHIMPRPDLASVGVRYRRIPILSIDGDIYCDTDVIISKLCALVSVPNSREFEVVGREIFFCGVGVMPAHYIEAAGEAFIKDRSEMMGRAAGWSMQAVRDARPENLSHFIVYLDIIEHDYLEDGKKKFFKGDKATVADVHVMFVVNWIVINLKGCEGDVSEKTHPNVFKWIADVKEACGPINSEIIKFEDAKKVLLEGKRVPSIGVNAKDPLSLKEGLQIGVTPTDNSKNHPQTGKLVGLSTEEIVVDTVEGARVHLPRLRFTVSQL